MTFPTATLERAATARLLSIGLSQPDATTLGELRELAGALADGAPPDDPINELVATLGAQPDANELAGAFEELFGGRVACSPYEAGYEPDPFRGMRQMADVAGFYRAFGAVPEGPAAERPDHVACELEFLAFLAARRLEFDEAGRADDADFLAGIEDSFLRTHLSRFMGPLCAAMEAATELPTYRALAQIGTRFITGEIVARGLDPPRVRRPGPSGVEGDEVTCGGANGCPLTDLIGRPERANGGRA